jgi:hypothetical protein
MRRILATAAAALSISIIGLSASMAQDSGLSSMHDVRREGGRVCMSDHFHYGSGSGTTKQKAIAAAAASWSDFTAFEYGGGWASFKRSASKQVNVSQGASGWTADVSSRPCR